MSKILKRPMFRKGGPTNEGIVSMAVPRGKYANSNIQDLKKQNPEMASTIKTAEGRAALISAFAGQGRSQNDRLSDLLIKGGLETMSARPDGNIFSTLAKSYKKPVDDYLKESQAEDSFQRQARLQGVTSAIGSEDARKLAMLKAQNKQQYLLTKHPDIQKADDIKSLEKQFNASDILKEKGAKFSITEYSSMLDYHKLQKEKKLPGDVSANNYIPFQDIIVDVESKTITPKDKNNFTPGQKVFIPKLEGIFIVTPGKTFKFVQSTKPQ
jgi:hypothetical protein